MSPDNSLNLPRPAKLSVWTLGGGLKQGPEEKEELRPPALQPGQDTGHP